MESEVALFFKLRTEHRMVLREAKTFSDCMSVYRACIKEKVFKAIAQEALVKATSCATSFAEYMTIYGHLSGNMIVKHRILRFARRIAKTPEEFSTLAEFARSLGLDDEWRLCAVKVTRMLRMRDPRNTEAPAQ